MIQRFSEASIPIVANEVRTLVLAVNFARLAGAQV
jgi:hypothetical protein